MAIQQIQKSSTFKPDMIGDLVEVTVYNKADGGLATAVGTLRAYYTGSFGLQAEFDGDTTDPSIRMNAEHLDSVTISITHYEYILELTSAEDDQ